MRLGNRILPNRLPPTPSWNLLWLDHYTYLCCMTEQNRTVVLNDDQWAVLGPLIDECRPRSKTEPVALRETIEAIV